MDHLPKTRPAISARIALILAPILAVWLLAAGCGGSSSTPANAGDEKLTIGYVGWADSVAVSKLTEAVMEEELGYEVELRRFENPEAAVMSAGSGDIDAFQSVWMPDHVKFLGVAEGERLLDPWLIGTTRSGLAAPSYMDVGSVEGMKRFEDAPIIGVEPGVAPGSRVSEAVADRLPERDISYLDTSKMLSEVDRRYSDGEQFFFTAWSPHWMNDEYEFEYLVDPEDEIGDATQPLRIHTVVYGKLGQEDPLAFAFLDTMQLAEHQVNGLELSIKDARSPRDGIESWLEDRDWLVQSWVGSTKRRVGED